MAGVMVTQGRELRAADIDLIQGLMAEHPDWGRTRLSEALCRRWDWRNAQGRFKDMAARTLLLKLERGGLIRLPRRQRPSSNGLLIWTEGRRCFPVVIAGKIDVLPAEWRQMGQITRRGMFAFDRVGDRRRVAGRSYSIE